MKCMFKIKTKKYHFLQKVLETVVVSEKIEQKQRKEKQINKLSSIYSESNVNTGNKTST